MDERYKAMVAKRHKQFESALIYCNQFIEKQGFSSEVLMMKAEIYYLLEQHQTAERYTIAAAHLAAHQELALTDNPHTSDGILYRDLRYALHVGHARLDTPLRQHQSTYLQPYAAIYYATLLADGSAFYVHQQYQLTQRQVQAFDQQRYIPIGLAILLEAI